MADETIWENKAIVKLLKGKIETNLSTTEVVNCTKYVEGVLGEDVVQTLCGRVESLRLDVTAEGTVSSLVYLHFMVTFLSYNPSIYIYRPTTKLREGNNFSSVCPSVSHSVKGSDHLL